MRRARLAVAMVPLAIVAFGLLALQAGAAFAVSADATLSIDSPSCPVSGAVGDLVTFEITATKGQGGPVTNLEVSSSTGDAVSGDQGATLDQQNQTAAFSFTHTLTLADDGTTVTVSGTGKQAESENDATITEATCELSVTEGEALSDTGFTPLPYFVAALLLLVGGGWVVTESRRRRV